MLLSLVNKTGTLAIVAFGTEHAQPQFAIAAAQGGAALFTDFSFLVLYVFSGGQRAIQLTIRPNREILLAYKLKIDMVRTRGRSVKLGISLGRLVGKVEPGTFIVH